jgi:hypothetical protein
MTEKRRKAAQASNATASAWEQRTLLVKREVAAANAASVAKTARLRALRLERDRQEAEAEASATLQAVKPTRKSSSRSGTRKKK